MSRSDRNASWDSVELGDMITLHRGYDLPSSQRRNGTIPVVSSSGITGYHDKPKIQAPGVVTGRYGTLGEVFFVEEPFWPLNTTLYVSDFHGNNERFISYFLQCQGLRTRDAASAVPGINRNVLHRLPARRPPISAQRKIAAILSAYDDLIENNNRRINLLEEMAQRLYREWFVDFRFPGHESILLVDSALGSIPQGWSIKTIGEVASRERYAVTSGPFGSKLGTKDYKDRGVPVIRGVNLAVGGGFRDADFVFVSDEKADTMPSCLSHRGDIVVTQRGTLGQVGLIPSSARFDRYVLSQSQMKITADPAMGNVQYLYAALRSTEVTARLQRQAITAGVPHINLALLRNFQVVWPARTLQVRFAGFVRSLGELVENLARASENAEVTRSLLLPRLISGEIDVTELDVATPEAVT
jgi:type I restriction enzyme, S subunit